MRMTQTHLEELAKRTDDECENYCNINAALERDLAKEILRLQKLCTPDDVQQLRDGDAGALECDMCQTEHDDAYADWSATCSCGCRCPVR